MPLKYLSNFWRSVEMPLINCKVELKFKWAMSLAGNENNINVDAYGNNIIFSIKHTKLCVPVVTLSAKDNQKL